MNNLLKKEDRIFQNLHGEGAVDIRSAVARGDFRGIADIIQTGRKQIRSRKREKAKRRLCTESILASVIIGSINRRNSFAFVTVVLINS